MKVTVAHMGRLAHVVRPSLEELGLDVVIAPKPSKATLSSGVRLSPEFACLPLKLNIGTFLEAAKAGADTILMAGGVGPCRFGYYAEIQRAVLEMTGVSLRMIVLEPPKGRLRELLATLKDFVPGTSIPLALAALRRAVHRIALIDELERQSLAIGAAEVEENRSRAQAVFEIAADDIASSRTTRAASEAAAAGLSRIRQIPIDKSLVRAKVVLLGEIYCVLEPFVNMDVAWRLARLRVHVEPAVTLSGWVRQNLTLNPIRRAMYRRHLLNHSEGYLGHWVGGEGLETVAYTSRAGDDGFDGVVQVAPFTCMPEIVAQSILPRLSRDKDIPYLSLFFDEHSSETGLETRLEAFVDMLEMRRH